MQRKEFGPAIRRLREQAGFNQRKLADILGIDVSYLSKIETGVVQPPSQELIIKLANTLGADKDELLTLAGKVPADIARIILKNRNVLHSLRDGGVLKNTTVHKKEIGFNKKLKELREKAGFSQAELATRVGISFTYLSKIESGIKPPPSEKVITRLAETLECNKDELMSLAGKIPSDIAYILKNREVRQSIRNTQSGKAAGKIWNIKGAEIMRSVLQGKSIARVALALVLVLAVGASLWFATPQPAKALTIAFPSIPPTATTGNVYSFQTKVSIETMDILPVDSISLQIRSVASPDSYTAAVTNMPIPGTGSTSTTQSFTSAQTGGGDISVTATTALGWIWTSNLTGRTGYGYRDPGGMGYHVLGSGFGYGYGYGRGNTDITYSIVWTPPAGWPQGNYNIKLYVYGDAAKTMKWSGTSSSFVLSTPSFFGVGGGPGPVVTPVTTTGLSGSVSLNVDSNGTVQTTAQVTTTDQQATMTIPAGTKALDSSGKPLGSLSAAPVINPPAPPAGNVIVLDYNFGPDGATFNPPMTLTMTYDSAKLPAGTTEANLVIAYYDGSKWVSLPCTVNTTTHTVTAQISHFTQYAIMGTAAVSTPSTTTTTPTTTVSTATSTTTTPATTLTTTQTTTTTRPTSSTTPATSITTSTTPPPPSGGMNIWVWIVATLAVVAVIVVIMLVIKRRNA